MSWAWAFGFAFFYCLGMVTWIWPRENVDGWRDALHLTAYVTVHVVCIAVGAKGVDWCIRTIPEIVTASSDSTEPSPSHGPPVYVVDIAAPAPAAPSTPWASAVDPLGDSIAHVNAICNALVEIKGADLARDWRGVCVEIAARAPGHGVRPALAVAVAWHESRLYRHAIGALGEVGPLQVRPEMHCGGTCADPIGAGLTVLARYVGRHGEADGMCRYRGAPVGCDSPRVALANEIEEVE